MSEFNITAEQTVNRDIKIETDKGISYAQKYDVKLLSGVSKNMFRKLK